MSESIFNSIPNELLSPSESFEFSMSLMNIYWWYWDHRTKELILSPRLIEILGYREDEYNSKKPTVEKNIHPDDLNSSISAFTGMLRGESDSFEMEYRLRNGGEWQWYYNRGAIISRDKDGNPELIGGVTMDISMRYKRMMERVEEGSKFEFLFKYSNEPVLLGKILPDDASYVMDANEAAGRLFDCSVQELLGRNPFDLFREKDMKERVSLTDRIVKEGKIQLKSDFKVSKGKRKFIKVDAHLLSMTGEDLFISVIQDRTESHVVKEELKASELALRGSEYLYRVLIQSADDRIGLFDLEGKPLIVNSAFSECLGYTPEEYAEYAEMDNVHPDDKEYLNERKILLPQTGTLSSEYRVQHKDGHYLTMSSKSVLIRDQELGKDYVLFIMRDISESKAFQKELIEAKEKAVESDLLKSAFLANMSHEIRTPMNSIIGFANLLSDGNLEGVTRNEYISRINKNSEQLLALISDIIDLAKIESNQLAISYSKVILESLFSELVNYGEMQGQKRKKSDLKVKYHPDKKYRNIEIETDLVRLMQIMQNLLNNAVKFTASGEIVMGYKVFKEHITFFVKDTGIGIDEENFEMIFDQFRQVDGSHTRKFGGTGLGLAICRNLAGLLDGKIWVESEKDKGASFFVELPMVSGYSLRKESVIEKGEEIVIPRECTILMVDDDPDSLMLISTLLRSEGISVITAESGYKALEILERGVMPALVLLDLQMPVLNGYFTLNIIKELYPGLKVVAQSAHALEGDKKISLKKGFDDHISKPYGKEDLLKVIRKFSKQ